MSDVVLRSLEADVTQVHAVFDEDTDEIKVLVKWSEEADWQDLKLTVPAGSVNVRDKLVIEIRREPSGN